MAARIEPLITVDDLDAMPDDGNRYEVIEGELFVSRAPGLPHQLVVTNIIGCFLRYLDEHPIGRIVTTPGLILNKYSGVIPDLVFYSHARGDEIIWNERLNAAPEIVIEILSPGHENVSRDRITKRQLYGKHGVKEYWIVDSDNRSIEIYRPADQGFEPVAMLRYDENISSPLLPGFSCPLARIFES